MKRNLLLTAGALALTVFGAFAGKMFTKTAVNTLYGKDQAGTKIEVASQAISGNFTTVNSGSLHQAVINTSGSAQTAFKLYSTANCTIPVYFQ
jgi:hypothetical protein